jgi:hypothetical protein
MHVISGPPGSSYPRLVLDRDWRLVGALNEWYRLRANVGAPSTRDTYLRVLSPFFGFLLIHNWASDAEPTLMRKYTRAYLQAIGCLLRRDRDGKEARLLSGPTGNMPRTHGPGHMSLAGWLGHRIRAIRVGRTAYPASTHAPWPPTPAADSLGHDSRQWAYGLIPSHASPDGNVESSPSAIQRTL